MNSFKRIIKLFLSDYLIGKFNGIFYGWHGNFNSWDEAKEKSVGYDDKEILARVSSNALKVKNGDVPFERDSVVFRKIVYSFPLLAGLMWISAMKNNRLNVLDFGGSLGTSYYQNFFFLNTLSEVNWCIVEQPHFVQEGNKLFSNHMLHFYNSIDECVSKYNIDLILLSSVLMYIEKPYQLLEEILRGQFEYVIVDRTLFVESEKDRLTIQRVPGKIYKASYCCWFLSEEKFLNYFLKKYDLIYDFNIEGIINIKSLYKGYLFKIKEEFK